MVTEIAAAIDKHFNTFSPDSKVWIFLANQTLRPHQEALDKDIGHYLASWKAHGAPLEAKHLIIVNRFLIVAVNNEGEQASGCSIDGFVNYIIELKDKYKVDFLNRTLQAVVLNDELLILPLEQIKEKLANKELGKDNLTFVNSINSLISLQEKWIISIEKSWLARYII